MIDLTLNTDKIVAFNDLEDLNTVGMLKSLFYGECLAHEGEADEECEHDYLMLADEIHAGFEKCYIPVVKATWNFAKNPFESYVQDWMNLRGIDDVFKFLYGTKHGALLPLMDANHALLTLLKYHAEIEAIIDEMADGMGFDFWHIFFDTKIVGNEWMTGASKFKCETLPLIAFEKTVRRVMDDLLEW